MLPSSMYKLNHASDLCEMKSACLAIARGSRWVLWLIVLVVLVWQCSASVLKTGVVLPHHRLLLGHCATLAVSSSSWKEVEIERSNVERIDQCDHPLENTSSVPRVVASSESYSEANSKANLDEDESELDPK